MDETGKMLIKIGKRGRKHGLGVVGISQRPADVKKDFITQANWLVWHRLTWENDTKVVGRIVGSEYADAVPDLDAGEAFVGTDWTDDAVRRVQFKRKRTFDAGATPGLEEFERPELKSVSDALVEDLADITEKRERERERVADLEAELDERDERIAELERELESARNVSAAARKMANAVSGTFSPDDARATLGAKNLEIDRLHDRVAELESRLEALDADALDADAFDGDDHADGDADDSALGADGDGSDDDAMAGGGDSIGDDSAGDDSASDSADDGEPTVEEYVNQVLASGGDSSAGFPTGTGDTDDGDEVEPAGPDSADETEDSDLDPVPATDPAPATDEGVEILGDDGDADAPDWAARVDADADDLADLLAAPPVAVKVEAACRQSLCNEDHAEAVVAALVADAPVTVHDIAGRSEVSVAAAYSLLSALRARDLVVRDGDRRYAFDPDALESLVEQADDRAHLGELREQWRVE
jgi:sugar-specific transcriptional regulator TrmB